MSAASCAQEYCEKYRMALTWSPPGAKGPRHRGWNLRENAITEAAAAFDFWTKHPTYGIGALQSFSNLVSIDVDHAEHARTVLASFDIDLEELASKSPCIVGRPGRYRVMFAAPADELKHRSASWPKEENPRESSVIFEMRAGTISDALPPTIHPATGMPYRWANPPRDGFPPLPARMLEIWINWQKTEATARAMCPWATPPARAPTRSSRAMPVGESVIDAFNAAHDVRAILIANGYAERGHDRFAPLGSNHAAGLVVKEEKVFCHHASDILFDNDKRPRDAFDVWCVLEHGGDVHAAVRSAAEILGLNRVRRNER